MGLFPGRQAEAGKPELGPATAFDDDASCEAAERTERENPGWIVVFGVFTKEFVCFPRFPAPAGTVITALYPDAIPPRMRTIERAPSGQAPERRDDMMKAKKELLSGTPDKVSARLEELCRELDQHEYLAGAGLRMLAVELTKRPNLKVSLVTYLNESQVAEGGQELEIMFPDDPHCEPVMIDRDHIGEHCQITWDRWLRIGNDTEIETAADMIASILNTCARFGAKQTPVAGVGAEAWLRPASPGGKRGARAGLKAITDSPARKKSRPISGGPGSRNLRSPRPVGRTRQVVPSGDAVQAMRRSGRFRGNAACKWIDHLDRILSL